MRFFDLPDQSDLIKRVKERVPLWLPRGVRPAAPRFRNVSCICFLASAALVASMIAAGLPVRSHPLYPDRYVVPHESVSNVEFSDLLSSKEFIFLSTVIFVVSGTTQVSPADWNNANNAAEAIAGGGSGGSSKGSATDRVGGGGGAEYRKVNNFSVLVPGTTSFVYVIGTGGTGVLRTTTGRTVGNAGTDTTFDVTSLVAKAGGGGGATAGSTTTPGGTGGTGGTGAADNGDGGVGGGAASNVSRDSNAMGGGGAGGPAGAGNQGVDASTTNSQTAGGSGDAGSGGAGGTAGNNGGNGTEWDASHGSGGGGGGDRQASNPVSPGVGGNYGGGGGAALITSGAGNNPTSAAGGPGIVVLTYTPAVASGLHRMFLVF